MNAKDAAHEIAAVPAGGLAFGDFRLFAGPLRLSFKGEDVRLGSRALTLLQALLSRPGTVFSRSELEALVWPSTVVEDSSLRVHVAALRRALGDGADGVRYIVNVPGRGYSFAAPVSRVGVEAAAPAPPQAGRINNLPASLTRLFGRDTITATLCAELEKRRLVSIVGHGGIGKTSLALAVAARAQAHYPAGVSFVDLAPLAAGRHVIGTVASALGMPLPAEATIAKLEDWLRPRRLLLVLDNCEHLLDDVTALVERILKRAPGLVILTTSREPLDSEGEWVHRIQPLEAPPEGAVDAAGVLGFSAVQLLVDRAGASLDTFAIDAENAALAAGLCRRLDGVPLAIEFAASRIGLLGLQGVCDQVGDRLRLLGSGRRTALPRHRTLRALLDWSYDLLAPQQQTVLRRCGVFRGGFLLDAAAAVAADDGLPADAVQDCLSDLVAKCLVRVDLAHSPPSYSLLEITRVYALDRLDAEPGRREIFRRHAECMLALIRRAAFAWVEPARLAWFHACAAQVGNFRAAFDWCFGPEGDAATGIELLATDFHAMTLFLGDAEFRLRAGQSLDAIAAGTPVHPIYEIRLYYVSKYVAPLDGRTASPLPGAVALAGQEEDVEAQFETLHHLWAQHIREARYDIADSFARRIETVARRCGASERLHAGRLRASSMHFCGEHGAAAAYATSLLQRADLQVPLRVSGWISWQLTVHIVLARLYWIQGQGERAMAHAAECVHRGQEERFPAALSQTLCLAAIPVALWQGDDTQASLWLQMLENHLAIHPLVYFASWAQHLRQVLALRAAPAGMFASLSGAADAKLLDHLVTFGAWGEHERALYRWNQGHVGWNGPELLRIGGELLLRRGDMRQAGAAEAMFLQALALAERQDAKGWGLRAANSLAKLRRSQGRCADARALLLPWLSCLDAMGGSADAAETRALLDGGRSS